MDSAQFFAASRLIIVAGKGGVGKTTVAATLARAAARSGRDNLIIEVEGKNGLATAFEREELVYEPTEMWPPHDPPGAAAVEARALTADDALLEYLADHGLDRISRRLVRSGALQVVATAAPGIEDILLLGKVKQVERANPDRLIILDTPAAGHAVTFLRSAQALLDTATAGPIHAQAAEVLELLTDPARTRLMLVTIPEETPVNELIETAYRLEDEIGVALAPIVINNVVPDDLGSIVDPATAAAELGIELEPDVLAALGAVREFRLARFELQRQQLQRLDRELPLPQIHLPATIGIDLGRQEINQLATAFLAGVMALSTPSVLPGANE